MSATILRMRAQELIDVYGSTRAAADAIGMEYSYLHRLSTGEKSYPSDKTLAQLGLRRVITYERVPMEYKATPLTPRTKSA